MISNATDLYTLSIRAPYTIAKPTSRNHGISKQVVVLGSKYWMTTWKMLNYIKSSHEFSNGNKDVCLSSAKSIDPPK
jgi:hypothetical protein